MLRTWFPLILICIGLSAVSWAVYGSRLPPADFTFGNESEIQSVDPARVSGHPEGRICWEIYEGLTRPNAETMLGEPGVAESWDISDDGLVYTFHLRPDARWSNGDPVTAHDFHYSIRRLLDPLTAAEYAYQAWYIVNARRYTRGAKGIEPEDPVEVELNPPPGATNTMRGELLLGTLVEITGNADKLKERVFVVRIDGKERRFQVADDGDALPPGIEPCRQVLLDFREVGIRVIDDLTLEMRLTNPTPFWIDLLSFYPLSPVHRGCLEKYGAPAWTRPENIVGNGAFRLHDRRIRDRIRLVRNEHYWDRENVRLNVVDALSADDRTTVFNLYETGMNDWVTVPPVTVIREVLASKSSRNDVAGKSPNKVEASKPPRNDINPSPMLATYFYMVNTTRRPLDDVRVRQALSMALDREEITRVATAAGEQPAFGLVPPNLPGYTQQKSAGYNPERARELLVEAGYPDGRGMPKIEIHYNTEQGHQAIAELARKQWQRELGITVTLRNEEWASAQATQRLMTYMLSRRTWNGDYLDPNTFLDMYVTGGENNSTGFSNPEYDQLIADAAQETDEAKRMKMLERAERILMDEMPIIPIYFYFSKNMVKPYVRGWYNNLQDQHPLRAIWIDHDYDPNDPRPNEFMRSP